MIARRFQTPRPDARKDSVRFDLQIWLERRAPGEEAGFGVVVFEDECGTTAEAEAALDAAFARLKGQLFGGRR